MQLGNFLKQIKSTVIEEFLSLKQPPWWLPPAKNPPANPETQVLSMVQEDILENEMATHSSILAWKIPWTEDPGGQLSIG